VTDADDGSAALAAATDRLAGLGVRRVESYAWRDLDDVDAGGSEVHADEILRRWAAAGLGITHRTSTRDEPRTFERNGYRVVQRGGRYDVFARVAARQAVRRRPPDTATLEIWNGVPWFGPLWAPRRRLVWMHHVHREMWDDALPRPWSGLGRAVETRLAPWCYRWSTFCTLSDSSADEIAALGIPRRSLHVIPPGVDERYRPAPERRSQLPHVVVVGRLAPVKRQRLALEAVARARREHPALTVELIGDGPDRRALESWIDDHDAGAWASIAGRVDDAALLDAYRRAWVVLSASHAEGWGMSLTEGGACGTPAVATDIAGHRGAVMPGTTGLLVPDAGALGPALATVLRDGRLRSRLGAAARRHAGALSWTAVAARQLTVLGDVVAGHRDRRRDEAR
jgi:glycosyltransferase involved in cell wall biosynthesis